MKVIYLGWQWHVIAKVSKKQSKNPLSKVYWNVNYLSLIFNVYLYVSQYFVLQFDLNNFNKTKYTKIISQWK